MKNRYLVRNSDDRVEDESQVREPGDPGYTAPWAPPASPNWDQVPGTYRHEDKELGSSSCPTGIRDHNNAHLWTLPGGTWTPIDQTTQDAEGLPSHQEQRMRDMVAFQAECLATDTILAGAYSQSIKDAAQARKDYCTARLSAHEAAWDDPWVVGSNP